MKVVLVLILAVKLCQTQTELANSEIGSDCAIPNQSSTKGVCIQRKNCLDYNELFNVTDLTVERLSFIINLDCGFDFESWKSLVCCPKPGNSYKFVTLTFNESIKFCNEIDFVEEKIIEKLLVSAERENFIS